METKKWILTALMMITLIAVAFAGTDTTRSRPGIEKRKAFYRAEVLPIMQEQQQKLLEAMTAEDAEAVRSLSTQMRDNMLVLNELHCELEAARIRREAPSESLLQEIEAQRILVRSIADRASSLAVKYDGTIDMLMNRMRATIRERLPERADGKPWRPHHNRGFSDRSGRRPGPDGLPHLSPEVRFMLWSGRQG